MKWSFIFELVFFFICMGFVLEIFSSVCLNGLVFDLFWDCVYFRS